MNELMIRLICSLMWQVSCVVRAKLPPLSVRICCRFWWMIFWNCDWQWVPLFHSLIWPIEWSGGREFYTWGFDSILQKCVESPSLFRNWSTIGESKVHLLFSQSTSNKLKAVLDPFSFSLSLSLSFSLFLFLSLSLSFSLFLFLSLSLSRTT
jgi:hypothetical protein